MTEDIRWPQRLSNYQRALDQLNQTVTLSQQRALSDLARVTVHGSRVLGRPPRIRYRRDPTGQPRAESAP